MGKSLTETAKAILMKEGMIPSVSPMDAGDPDRGAKSMTPNMATLRPGSRGAEGPIVNPGSMPPTGEQEDLGGQTPTSGAPVDNLGARAAGKTKKDSSRSGVSAVPQEPMKKMSMAEEMEEEEKEEKDKKKKLQELYRQIKEAKKAEEDKEDSNKGLSSEHKKFVTNALNRIHGDGKVTFHTNEYGNHTAKHNDGVEEKTHAIKVNGNRVIVDKEPFITSELEEEIEMSEELEAFIDAMIEEGYSEDQIAEAIEENFEVVSEESHEEKEDMKAEKAKHKKEKMKEMMKEHVDALLDGEQLSEEFRVKAETIFESAVNTRLQEELSVIEEAYAESLQEEVSAILDQLTEQVDDYLNYVVEQWVAENEVAIETGLRSELTEDFISGLRNLFAEHYIDVPEEKVSIVEGLAEKVEALEGKLNEEIERNVSLNKMLAESKKYEVLRGACTGLTDTQADKLFALAENIDFNSTDEYARKIHTLKESYFPNTVTAQSSLDHVEDADGKSFIAEELQGPMNAYVRALGKSLPK
jgi:hypothetical protein